MLLLLFRPSGPIIPGFNLSQVVAEMAPPLNARVLSELHFWTEAELYEWASEGGQRFARRVGGFLLQLPIAILAGQSEYALNTSYLSVIHAYHFGLSPYVPARAMLATTVQELEAADEGWKTTYAVPEDPMPNWWLVGELGIRTLHLYPVPAAVSSANVTGHGRPGTLTAAGSQMRAPDVLKDWFRFFVLAEARRRESEAQLLEVAAWYDRLHELISEVAMDYWGAAQ